jgi:Mce-associated membrane protein
MTGTIATSVRDGEDGRAVDEPDRIEEPVADEQATPRGRRPVLVVTAVLLVVLLIGSVVAAVLTGQAVQKRRHADAFEHAALAAGRDAAVAFTTYDYRHLDTDLSRVTERSTGTFRTQFTSALGALTEAIKQAHGVSTGHVAYAGLLRHSGQTAVVLAAVDASITNTATPKPSTRRYRLQITLDHSSGSWLISQIAPVA